jgi:DNA-binding helix-turn-helix protein
MLRDAPTSPRAVFNALKLERYRASKNLHQRDIAKIAEVSHASYYEWLINSYVALKKLNNLKRIEEVYGIDLEIEMIPAMTKYEARAYAEKKYKPLLEEEDEENQGLLLYPKDCQRCPWRRGAMCLTPLCMKRRHEYDPAMPWGSHLEIHRGTNKS